MKLKCVYRSNPIINVPKRNDFILLHQNFVLWTMAWNKWAKYSLSEISKHSQRKVKMRGSGSINYLDGGILSPCIFIANNQISHFNILQLCQRYLNKAEKTRKSWLFFVGSYIVVFIIMEYDWYFWPLHIGGYYILYLFYWIENSLKV